MSFRPDNHNENEEFSPLFMAGLMIRPLPRAPLNLLLQYTADHIQKSHPAILTRLEQIAGTVFLIQPTDFPHDIRLTIQKNHVSCQIEDEFMGLADVTICGPLLSLMDMMDGKLDGDALFFSRHLTIEGDTAALLTLRNAVDSDDIDLWAEIIASFGLLAGPAKAVLNLGDHLYQSLSRNMGLIGRAITLPLSKRCEGLEHDNQNLRNRLDHLDKMLTKTQNRLQSLSRKTKI
ncbi:MAG: SCP2 sterol-binding domain-containing protein [Emcibacter sp.]|nr:SCP2 sterol-binding domain-containing protein [Emcibacter sp.]